MAFAYVVRCTFEDAHTRDVFFGWLRDRHVGDVIASGALDGEIVLVDSPTATEVRYRFASREAYNAYEQGPATARRQEGLDALAKLGVAPDRGVVFTRWTGVVQGPTSSPEASNVPNAK